MTPGFDYRDGVLHAEAVSLQSLAEAVGTPFYCYALGAVEAAYRDFESALDGLAPTICYALKANSNLAVVRSLARLGAGADVVSEGELRVALAAGVPAERIVFAGVGKTAEEMAFALDAGIMQFNVESRPELELLSQVALARGTTAPVALRINPDVDALTHAKISTGKAENKFGIDFAHAREAVETARAMPGISLEGLAIHIGSQVTDLEPFRAAFGRVAGLHRDLRAEGVALRRLDLGGGLGIAYQAEASPDFEAYAAIVREATAAMDCQLIFEPGRSMVGQAGVLVTKVLYIKHGIERRFVILDAGMNDLIRPTLYDAWHDIVPLAEPAAETEFEPFDVVGPICESADTFARQRPLPPLEPGALIAICSTGAYSAVMASSYNSRRPAPEVVVRGDQQAVVRPRTDYEALIARDRLPTWLEERPAAPAAEVSRGAA